MTTPAAGQLDDTPSPIDLQRFVYLANDVFELLEAATRELDRDLEGAPGVIYPPIGNRARFACRGCQTRCISSPADSAPAFLHR
jgi:hypothetical protein